MKSSPRRAAALVRVSTDQQADYGGSIDDQLKRIREWCAARGIELVATYGEGDRSGGKLATSPGFVRMLSEAGSDQWDMLVVESTDRFRRNLRDAVNARHELKVRGKQLYILNCGEYDLTEEGGPGSMLFTLLSVQAELERKSFMKRGAAGHRTKISRAAWNGGRAPTGYRAVSRDGLRGLEKDPALEPHMDFLWSCLKNGWATHRIARALEERGCQPTRGTKPFSQATVNQIAHNPIHAGHNWAYDEQARKDPGKLGLQGKWPAYVSPDDWLKIQKLLADRKNPVQSRGGRPSKHFLLARGLARCGRCGEVLWTRKDDHSDYYYCASRKSANPCGAPTYTRRLVDHLMRAYIVDEGLVDVDAALARARDRIATDRTTAAKSVGTLRTRVSNLARDLDQLSKCDLDDALIHLYRAKSNLHAAAVQQLADAERRLTVAQAAEPTAQQRRIALEAFQARFRYDDENTIHGLQDQLRDTLDQVTVHHGIDYIGGVKPGDPVPPTGFLIIQPKWKPTFMRSLLIDLELDEGVEPSPGETIAMAWARNRRRRAGSRARGRVPRCVR